MEVKAELPRRDAGAARRLTRAAESLRADGPRACEQSGSDDPVRGGLGTYQQTPNGSFLGCIEAGFCK